MASIDLFQVIFEQILKIDPNIISNYTTLQDQFLYLILIPHVVLLLFIYAFSRGFVNRFITGGHIAFSYLLGIVVYIYIVWSGFYGGFLVSFLATWLYIAVGIALFVFLISIFWHPAAGKVGGALIGKIFSTVAEKTVGKEKERDKLEREIRALDRQIMDIENRFSGRPMPRDIERDLVSLRTRKIELEERRDNL